MYRIRPETFSEALDVRAGLHDPANLNEKPIKLYRLGRLDARAANGRENRFEKVLQHADGPGTQHTRAH